MNGNGIQDAGETPIAGVEVALSGGSGAFTVQTLTDATGCKFFLLFFCFSLSKNKTKLLQ